MTKGASFTPIYNDKDYDRERLETDPYLSQRTPFRRDYTRLLHSATFRRLQRKTQLFPSENDFFRNRLTHSLEVAQIAKSIVGRLNRLLKEEFYKDESGSLGKEYYICDDLVEFASLAHDIGHPPFGHNGERALDRCMASAGGFEGNAQSIRIVTKLIKRVTRKTDLFPFDKVDGTDLRLGINPTYRSIAAMLKYNRMIDEDREQGAPLVKGYYSEESGIIKKVQKLYGLKDKNDKVLECQIMDIADDIAYSCYDFEDAMKSGATNPLDILEKSERQSFLERFAVERVSKAMKVKINSMSPQNGEIGRAVKLEITKIKQALVDLSKRLEVSSSDGVLSAYKKSCHLADDGYLRSTRISNMVTDFIDAISIDEDSFSENPSKWKIVVEEKVLNEIEILKDFTFHVHIESSRLKSVEARGKLIVTKLFEALQNDRSDSLLPSNYREAIAVSNKKIRNRLICDHIAGMTDRYAIELYDRLFSTKREHVFGIS